MAEEARAIAMRTRDPAAKERMLEIAASYDRLAKRSEALARRARENTNRHPITLIPVDP